VSQKYYTDEKNAQIVLALLKAHGVRKIVVSPGATNVPIAGSLLNDSFFEAYSAPDERSAAYIACGLASESGEMVALSCTGATASRNYLPGLTEAYYRKLPIIAVTSMPPFRSVGHLQPQAIDRSVVPKDVVRISVSLATVKDREDFKHCEFLVNNALLEARRRGGGPVHINLERAGSGAFDTVDLPKVRVMKRCTSSSEAKEFPMIPCDAKVAVFIGAHKAFTDAETMALEKFVRRYGCVVLCDHTSSYRGEGRIGSALVCSQGKNHPELQHLKPDVLIHIGEISGDTPSYVVCKLAKTVWRVGEDGELRDLFGQLEYVFEMREEDFFQRYANNENGDRVTSNAYFSAWREHDTRLRTMIPEIPFSNTWIAHLAAPLIPENSILHFGILNSLRNWNFFEVASSIHTACNVGGFGIDGCVSTLIGASLAEPSKLCFGVFGDLAFFYDMNSLGNRHIGANVRILLINNGGGGEFMRYNHYGSQFGERTKECIAAAWHYGDKSPDLVRHYAQDLGFTYLSAKNKEEFKVAVAEFVSPMRSEKPLFFECFTNFEDDSGALYAMEHVDSRTDSQAAVRDAIVKILPKSVKNTLKNILEK